MKYFETHLINIECVALCFCWIKSSRRNYQAPSLGSSKELKLFLQICKAEKNVSLFVSLDIKCENVLDSFCITLEFECNS